MLNISVNELSALTLALRFMSVEELLNAAMQGYALEDSVSTQNAEKSDVCWKAIKAFL